MNYFDNSLILCGLCEKPLRALRLKHVFALLAGVVFTSINSLAQLDTAIVRTFGGPYYEEGRQIIECAEGGYAIIGTTGSDQLNNTNFYLLRLDEELNCLWSQNYGGAEVEWGYSIVEDVNNNLLVCGYTNSFGEGGYDILVYKVDPLGNVIWQKTYGGSDWDFAYKMIAHPEEGYLICGKTYSYGNGGSDAYLLHISEDGNLINEWTYGGEGDDEFRDMDEDTNNSTVALLGSSEQLGEIEVESKCLLLILDNTNSVLLENIINSNDQDFLRGISCSFEQDRLLLVMNYRNNDNWYNYIVAETDLTGNILWSDSGDYLNPSCIIIAPDNGYIATGSTMTYGLGGSGALIEKRYSGGWFQAAPTFGEVDDEFGNHVMINSAQELLLLGSSNSYNTNVTSDVYLVKTPTFNLVQEYNLEISHSPCFEVSVKEELGSLQNAYISNNHLYVLGVEQNQTYKIYDTNGRVVLIENTSNLPTDVTGLSSGLYYINFVDNKYPSKKIFKI